MTIRQPTETEAVTALEVAAEIIRAGQKGGNPYERALAALQATRDAERAAVVLYLRRQDHQGFASAIAGGEHVRS